MAGDAIYEDGPPRAGAGAAAVARRRSAYPIKLLIAITDLDLGGSPLVAQALATGLRDTGDFAPTVVSLAPPGAVGEMLQKAGIPVLSCRARGRRDAGAVLQFVKLARRVQPDILYSMLVHANIAATCAKPFLPRCVFYQSIHTLQPRPRWHWQAQGLVSPAADGLIAPTRAVLNRVAKFGFYRRGFVVPNGIDCQLFRDAAPLPPSERPWPAGALALGFIGRFDAVKRLYLLIEAMVSLTAAERPGQRPWHLTLVGYGPEQGGLEHMAKRLGVRERVHFPGPSTMPHRWYKSFDFFVFPSISEGFGLALVEAMAAGVPIVACDSPATREILNFGRLGEVVDCQQKIRLADVLQGLSVNSQRVRARAALAAATVQQRYSVGAMVAEHSRIFKNSPNFFLCEKHMA